MSNKNTQYSNSEKISYHAGRAFARAKAGKLVAVKGERNKKSFRNGVNAERAKMKGGKK